MWSNQASRACQFAHNIQSFSTLHCQTCLTLLWLESTSPFSHTPQMGFTDTPGKSDVVAGGSVAFHVCILSQKKIFHKVLDGLGLPTSTDRCLPTEPGKQGEEMGSASHFLFYELLFPCARKASHLLPLFTAIPCLPARSLTVPRHRQPHA